MYLRRTTGLIAWLCAIAMGGTQVVGAAEGPASVANPAAVAALDKALRQARAEYALRRYDVALRQYRSILKAEAAAPGIPVRERSRAYLGILEVAPRLEGASLFTTGNIAAKAMVREEAAALGADSGDRLPGLLAAADWFAQTGQPAEERKQVEEIIRLVELAFGPRSANLAIPLVRLANTFITYASRPAVAKAALDRALTLDFDEAPDHAALKATVQIALGDYAVVGAAAGSGAPHYEAAWRTLSGASRDGAEAAAERFALPAPLRINIPPEPFTQIKGGDFFATGEVVFTFTVGADGHLADVAVLRKDLPVASLPTPVLKAFRQARYRPRMEDGRTVPTLGQEYRIIFR
jgi:hypothetical protein